MKPCYRPLGPGLVCWAVLALCRGGVAPMTSQHVLQLAHVPMRTMGCVAPCRLARRLTRARGHLDVVAAVPAAVPAASAAVFTAGRGVEHVGFTQTLSLPSEGNVADISAGDIAQNRDRRDQGLDAGIRGLCLYTSCPACRILTALEVQEFLNRRLSLKL